MYSRQILAGVLTVASLLAFAGPASAGRPKPAAPVRVVAPVVAPAPAPVVAAPVVIAPVAPAASPAPAETVLSGTEYGSPETGYCSTPFRRGSTSATGCASSTCTAPFRRGSTGSLSCTTAATTPYYTIVTSSTLVRR